MSIKIVNVFLNHYGQKINVGRLAYRDKIIYFEYSKEFLSLGIELSPYKLPLKSGVHICEDNLFEGLFGVFNDSLPDGWGRLLLDRYFLRKGINYRDITPLDRLSYVGSYGIGALTYEPYVDNEKSNNVEIDLDILAISSSEILQGNSEKMLDVLLNIGASSSGARPKAIIQLSDDKKTIIHGAMALKDGFSHYLVKFASAYDSNDIGSIEYIYSLMAKEAKIEMSDTVLLKGQKNSYFSIKRFDRHEDEKVHIHSVAGLTHSDFRFPTLDYDDLLSLTLHLTKDVDEQLKMFRLACFNLFAHNRDDHAKNFSFLLDRNGRWKLSPAYDLTFSYGPGGEHSTTYMGEGKNPTMQHLLDLAKKHNLKSAQKIITEVKTAVSNFQNYTKQIKITRESNRLILGWIENIMKLINKQADVTINSINEKKVLIILQRGVIS